MLDDGSQNLWYNGHGTVLWRLLILYCCRNASLLYSGCSSKHPVSPDGIEEGRGQSIQASRHPLNIYSRMWSVAFSPVHHTEFIDWRLPHSVMLVFSTQLCGLYSPMLPSLLLSGYHSLLSQCQSTVYTDIVWLWGGGGCWVVLETIFCRSFTLCIWPDSEHTKLLNHPKTISRREMGPKVHIYLEYQSGSPLVRIRAAPSPASECAPQGGRAQHDFSLAWLEAAWYSSGSGHGPTWN